MELTEIEVWKEIEGYTGLYEVSNLGRVRSIDAIVKNQSSFRLRPSAIKKIARTKQGYCFVGLSKNNIQKTPKVHRLVAQAFIPNPDNLPEVNHEDGNKENNCVSNLKRCTRAYNIQHAFRTGLIKSRAGKSYKKVFG